MSAPQRAGRRDRLREIGAGCHAVISGALMGLTLWIAAVIIYVIVMIVIVLLRA